MDTRTSDPKQAETLTPGALRKKRLHLAIMAIITAPIFVAASAHGAAADAEILNAADATILEAYTEGMAADGIMGKKIAAFEAVISTADQAGIMDAAKKAQADNTIAYIRQAVATIEKMFTDVAAARLEDKPGIPLSTAFAGNCSIDDPIKDPLGAMNTVNKGFMKEELLFSDAGGATITVFRQYFKSLVTNYAVYCGKLNLEAVMLMMGQRVGDSSEPGVEDAVLGQVLDAKCGNRTAPAGVTLNEETTCRSRLEGVLTGTGDDQPTRGGERIFKTPLPETDAGKIVPFGAGGGKRSDASEFLQPVESFMNNMG